MFSEHTSTVHALESSHPPGQAPPPDDEPPLLLVPSVEDVVPADEAVPNDDAMSKEDAPAAEEASVVDEAPSAEDAPAVEESPAVEDAPADDAGGVAEDPESVPLVAALLESTVPEVAPLDAELTGALELARLAPELTTVDEAMETPEETVPDAARELLRPSEPAVPDDVTPPEEEPPESSSSSPVVADVGQPAERADRHKSAQRCFGFFCMMKVLLFLEHALYQTWTGAGHLPHL